MEAPRASAEGVGWETNPEVYYPWKARNYGEKGSWGWLNAVGHSVWSSLVRVKGGSILGRGPYFGSTRNVSMEKGGVERNREKTNIKKNQKKEKILKVIKVEILSGQSWKKERRSVEEFVRCT